MLFEDRLRVLYNEFGQRKIIGKKALNTKKPHFFLQRTFLGEQDLLIIFNTKCCRYKCNFCGLHSKNSQKWIPCEDILAQFEYVMNELKHSLSVLDRVTISNEGSVLDSETLPTEALLTIAKCIKELRHVRTFVLETRLNFIEPKIIEEINKAVPKVKVNILTGFETLDFRIRDEILNKQETIKEFETGLDKVAETGADLTTFVLFKPSQNMTDAQAFNEANNSINYLIYQCKNRGISLTIRLNPMYAAQGSVWAHVAANTSSYKPPMLNDMMKLAFQKAQEGANIYIGLSTEGINTSWGTFRVRDDFSPELLKQAILFNNVKLSFQNVKHMEPISFDRLIKTSCVKCNQDGLTVNVPPSWIVDGEDRLSYSSLVRLIECCREYHWQKDILSKINKNDIHLDSICKSLSGDFINPIFVGSKVFISYSINEVRRKGYSLKFEVRNATNSILSAEFILVSIFYNPINHESIQPPDSVSDYLSLNANKDIDIT